MGDAFEMVPENITTMIFVILSHGYSKAVSFECE